MESICPWLNVHSFTPTDQSFVCHPSTFLEKSWRIPFRLLYSSLMSFAAKNCLTAHASTSSGATIIQNINSNRFHRAFHLLLGGTFGCTAVHAQRIVVDKQLQTIPNSVRFNCPGSASSRPTKSNIAGPPL